MFCGLSQMHMVIYRVQEVGPVCGTDGEHGAGLSAAAVHPIQLCEQLSHDAVHDAARVARFPPVKMYAEKLSSLNSQQRYQGEGWVKIQLHGWETL